MKISDDIKFKVEQAAGPIGFGRLQTIGTFLTEAKKLKLSMDDILDYIAFAQAEIEVSIKTIASEKKEFMELIQKNSPKCPECGTTLAISNIDPDNDNNYKTRWFCPAGFESDDPDGLCGYEKLNTETIEESYAMYGIIKEVRNAY